jgi:hypothetical protein
MTSKQIFYHGDEYRELFNANSLIPMIEKHWAVTSNPTWQNTCRIQVQQCSHDIAIAIFDLKSLLKYTP